jgi:autotransporter-associated beta strand protein
MPTFIVRSLALLLAAATPALAVPVIDGGIHYLLPDDQRTIPITVRGDDLVEGIDFYLQLDDGGVVNGGTATSPKITAIDLIGPGTLFSQSNTGSQATHLPDSGGTYLIWADWITTQPSDSPLSATGTLAYITLDTTGASASDVPYTLSFDNVAANYAPPGFDTDFADLAATIHSGSIIVTELRDLTWNAGRDGNWTETTWDGSVPGYPTCPNYTSRAIVNTPYQVQVDSAQEANQLTLSDGGQVVIGATDALAVTTTVNVNSGGILSLVSGAGLSAASINLAGGTISGSGTVNPSVSLAGGFLDAPTLSDTLILENALEGTGGMTKTGLGTVTLKDNATYTGSTIIQAGLLQLQGAASTLSDVSGGGTLQVGGGIASASLTAESISVGSLIIGSGSRITISPSGVSPAGGNASLVPEPSTVVLTIGAGLGLLFLCGRRKDRE